MFGFLMPPKKKVQEPLGPVDIYLHPNPAFAYASDRPDLAGLSFVGKDPETALINAKAYLVRHYKSRGYWPITITPKDDDDDEVE